MVIYILVICICCCKQKKKLTSEENIGLLRSGKGRTSSVILDSTKINEVFDIHAKSRTSLPRRHHEKNVKREDPDSANLNGQVTYDMRKNGVNEKLTENQ